MIISEKLIKPIKCKLGYHNYYLDKELTSWSRKIGCKNCRVFFGMNDDIQSVITWYSYLEEMYKTIGVL
jgi:hypothetical protein